MRIMTSILLMLFSSLSLSAVLSDTFESAALGVKKSYRIYVPNGYSTEKRRYPVIYLLHGWGVTENYWADNLGLANAADALNLQAIIVMPDGDRSYYSNSVSPVDYASCLSEIRPMKNKSESRASFCVKNQKY